MTVDDLLQMWADWSNSDNQSNCFVAKHPLAKLIDGAIGGAPIYCSFSPSGLPRDDRKAAQVEMAVAKLGRVQKKVVRAEYLQEGEQDEKAQRLCMNHITYRTNLHKAKKNLSLTLKHLLK